MRIRVGALLLAGVLGCSKPGGSAAAIATSPATASSTATSTGGAPGTAAAMPDVLTLRRPQGPEWFGIYLVGKKAGFMRTEVRVEDRRGKRVLVARAETEIGATVGTRTVKRVQRDEKVYEAKAGGRLLAFRSERQGDGGARSFTGTCGPDDCAVVVESEAGREERRLPHPGETAEQADAARLVAATGVALRAPQLEMEQLRVREVEDAPAGHATRAGAGVEVKVALVREQEVGDRAAIEVAVAGDGRILEMRMGDSLSARAEPEEVARRLDRVDLFNLTRVALPGPLPRDVPGAIAYRLAGLPPAFRKGDERQRYQGEGDETVLTVRARLPDAADPARDAPRGKGPDARVPDLAPTPEVDADAPAIRDLAGRVVGKTRGSYQAARLLLDEVNRRLAKAFGQSRDRASEVLAAGAGDCTEHAILFVALARAAGIPARPVHGLVYARYGDGADALYWHAWAEVRSGSEWISMDPTFGQPVADATHILLGRGSQVDTVGLLGSLRVLSAGRPSSDEP
jgi:hypothetical protein